MIVDKIKKREPTAKRKENKVDIPVGKWIKCEACKEILYKESVRENYSICPNCGHYFRMHINKRLESTIDEGTYKRFNLNLFTMLSFSCQSSFTFTHVFKFTLTPKFCSISIRAILPIFFNISPFLPIIIPLWEFLKQYIVASMS